MSAWIVSKAHIDALVQASIENGLIPLDRECADLLGVLLWEENRYSVAVRYPGDADGEWPGPIGLTIAEIHGYRFEGVEAPMDSSIILTLADCWEYQCAEFRGWDERPGAERVRRLRAAIGDGVQASKDVRHWGIDDIREAVYQFCAPVTPGPR